MHDDRRQVEDRIARVLRERLRPAAYALSVPLEVHAWQVPGEPVPVVEALSAPYEPFVVGTAWGSPWSTTWLRITGTVPPEWAGRRVEAVIDLGFGGDWPGFQAEGLVHDLSGTPLKGLEPGNRYVPVACPARGGEQVGWLVEAAANPSIPLGGTDPTLLGDRATAGDSLLYRLERADLAVLDEQLWHLTLDAEVLSDLMHALPVQDARRHAILRGLERALDVLDPDDVRGSAAAVRAVLAPLLAEPARASAHSISAVGHAHIDTAWLWPARETRRKAARTFANAVALARDYPELVFAGPQAQQYAWVKEAYPQLHEAIADAVKAGTWVPVGGMWVEADGNLPGGEALVRQLVHGKRYFLAEFGVETTGVWLPDSFGYTAAFPQLALLAGNDWFLTQKISWNQTNTFPHHTFWWEGIDGSRVFTHFPPADTYNATLGGGELAHAADNYADKGGGSRSLLPFGYGDGGGGPTREMLERARRTRDLDGSPRVHVEAPDAFFEAARAEYADAPVWSGELYLELHRGTFTTQARTKAGNRRSEHLLREAELWATTAAVRAPDRHAYPAEELDRIWKLVLLHQFHDILPGTSIAWVHREAELVHAQVRADLERLIADAVAVLAPAGTPSADGPPGGETWVLNTSPFARHEVVRLPSGDAVAEVPAGGIGRVRVAADGDGRVSVTAVDGGGAVVENGLMRVTVAADGTLASVRDLGADREVLAPGAGGAAGNLLQLHPDVPNHWDAWDVDRHYRRTARDLREAVEVAVVDDGPLTGSVRVVRVVGRSRIVQTVTVRAGTRRIDVHSEIDWHEREKFLKAAFPLDVHADRSASEIQFGHVQRPTHTNTSWDAARFEVYAHRWVHVGEPGYGVALLTDSTYGHDTLRSTRPDGGTTTTVRLSLLRSPLRPDPEADQGRHTFTYSLLPGASVSEAVAEAYALNLPLRAVTASAGTAPPPPVVSISSEADAALRGHSAPVVEAVKLADDGSGDVVVRLYEALGGRASGRVVPGFGCSGAWRTDLLERPLPGEPDAELGADGSVAVALRPFQVVTLRLSRLGG